MKLKRILILFMGILILPSVSVSGEYIGSIEQVWIAGTSDDTNWVKLSGQISNPSCTNDGWFVVSDSNAALELAASKRNETNVKIIGSGDCQGTVGEYEFARFIVFESGF